MLMIAMIATAAGAQAVPVGTDDAPPPPMGPVLPVGKTKRSVSLDVAGQAVACDARSDGEIVVCAARGDEGYRLHALPAEPVADGPPRAEMMIGNVKAAAVADSATMPRGEISKRAMVRFTLPF